MNYCIFHTNLLLDICLLLLTFIDLYCYYIKHQLKQKNITILIIQNSYML